MSDVIIPYRFVARRGTAAALAAANETPKNGEFYLATDTGVLKLGDGVTAYNSLMPIPGRLSDPNADRILFWDDSAGKYDFLTVGTGLTLSGTTLTSTGAGAMTLVGTATVAGSAATVLTLSGLDLATDSRYFVELCLDNATASAANVSLYYSADTTANNYRRQSMSVSGGAVSGARALDGIVTSLAASEGAVCHAWISNDRDGRPRAFIVGNRDAVNSITIHNFAHAWITAANVTSITFSSSVASSLAIGSYVKVWKLT